MLTTSRIYQLQSDYLVEEKGVTSLEEYVPLSEYVAECREYIQLKKTRDYEKLSAQQKDEFLRKNIQQFVTDHPMKVKGYVNEKGMIDASKLIEDLNDHVTGYAILKPALYDVDIDEIQLNDHLTVFVVEKGVEKPYTDENGNPYQFESVDEVETVINRLIDGGHGNAPQFTEGHPLLNAKTHEHQYRINAVHHSVNARGVEPYSFPVIGFTLRKFKEVKLTIHDIVKAGACTEAMGRLLMLFGRAEVKLFCVGPTASGKTTLLNSIAFNIPTNRRIILVQNPTEISFFQRDEYGRTTRNVLHWEVTSKASMSELTSNTLRASPIVIIVGEARDREEFLEILRVVRTGHRVLGTFHAESAEDALMRIAEETNTGSVTEALKRAASAIDIIVTQYKFSDGTRRIRSICEIGGVDSEGNISINTLFEFQMTGEVIDKGNGMKEVVGEFKQTGYFSKSLIDKFYLAAISKEEIAEFIDPNTLSA